MVKKITKRVRLDFQGAKGRIKEEMKQAAGEILTEEIIRNLDSSRSPVKQGRYKKLKKDGKPSELFEEGDLWASITFETYRDGVEVGVFDPDQVPKADNHNKNSAASKRTAVPAREFIPKNHQEFKANIQKKVEQRLKEMARRK